MFITLNRLFLHSFYLANVTSHIMVRNRQLSFFDQICQKSVFPVRKSTSGHYNPLLTLKSGEYPKIIKDNLKLEKYFACDQIRKRKRKSAANK